LSGKNPEKVKLTTENTESTEGTEGTEVSVLKKSIFSVSSVHSVVKKEFLTTPSRKVIPEVPALIRHGAPGCRA